MQKERAFAAEQSALVIDAYRTLSKPLPRALYMVSSSGSVFKFHWCTGVQLSPRLCSTAITCEHEARFCGYTLFFSSLADIIPLNHFLTITKPLAAGTWGDTRWWGEDYQWSRTSYGGEVLDLPFYALHAAITKFCFHVAFHVTCRWWRYVKLLVKPMIPKLWRRSNLRFLWNTFTTFHQRKA
jgi:hypothetical protein